MGNTSRKLQKCHYKDCQVYLEFCPIHRLEPTIQNINPKHKYYLCKFKKCDNYLHCCDKHRCAIEGCIRERCYNKQYCWNHGCSYDGCQNKSSKYEPCMTHVCEFYHSSVPCTSTRDHDSKYCHMHKYQFETENN